MMQWPVLSFAALLASTMFASDLVRVHTKVIHGNGISFWVENKYPAPITKFQIAAISSTGDLGCSITAEVKRPRDLHPPETCSFGTKDSKVIDQKWNTRLVYVEFADGRRWTSGR